MSEYSIIPAGPADIDAIMIVMQDAFDPNFGEAWTRGQCLGLLGLPGVWMRLAMIGTEPAGFALARVVLDEAELLLLGVRPARRRDGIGSALLDRIKQDALEHTACRLHLEVRDGNAALNLYAKHGFGETGRRRNYYKGADGLLFDALSLSFVLN